VVEDTGITAEELALAGVHPEVIEVVRLLTRRDGQGDEYYERIAQNPAARAVKLSDLLHNTHPERVAQLPAETRSKLHKKYEHAFELLGAPWPQAAEYGGGPHFEYGHPRVYAVADGDEQGGEVADITRGSAPAPRSTTNTHFDEHGRLVSTDRITAIDADEIFVFGANGRGRHGSGSARAAFDTFGAAWGVADGPTGQSYAIDTMSGEATMAAAIERFLGYAEANPGSVFLVTAIGTGIAGYTHAQVAQYFAHAGANVALPQEFWEALPLVPKAAVSAATALTPTEIPAQWLDRAVGAIVGMAIGDALGSQYEFGPSHPDDFVPEFGAGVFGHGIGEWTDDTSMALPILEAIARGDSLRDEAVLGWIVGEWDEWAKTAKDVGTQTRQVLDRLGGVHTEAAARAAAKANHDSTGRSAGNGSLMRTAPVALAYLEDGREKRLVEAAARVAQLTHWEASNVEACALWCLFIRQAIRTGDFDPWEQRRFIVDPDRGLDGAALIDQGLHGHPRDYSDKNGWVVKAFQSAHVAVRGASSFREAVHRAIQGGGDTDTVAAITGGLAGAKWGVSGIPLSWQREVHGWPGYDANDLARLAVLVVRRGESDGHGWPAGDSSTPPT
jgi:ADP-ribosylglycohydrolase